MDIVVRQVPGERKGVFHYVTANNFICHRYKVSVQSEYFRCRKYESLGCLARPRKTNHQYVKTGSEHNHENETEENGRIAVINKCVSLAGEQRSGLKHTFEEVRARKHEDAVIGYNHRVERRMQRGHRANQPSIPQTTEEADEGLLQKYPVYSRAINDASLFFHGRVSSATGSALIFLSLAILVSISCSS